MYDPCLYSDFVYFIGILGKDLHCIRRRLAKLESLGYWCRWYQDNTMRLQGRRPLNKRRKHVHRRVKYHNPRLLEGLQVRCSSYALAGIHWTRMMWRLLMIQIPPRLPMAFVPWQWQLKNAVNASYEVEIYDIDLFDSSVESIQ